MSTGGRVGIYYRGGPEGMTALKHVVEYASRGVESAMNSVGHASGRIAVSVHRRRVAHHPDTAKWMADVRNDVYNGKAELLTTEDELNRLFKELRD